MTAEPALPDRYATGMGHVRTRVGCAVAVAVAVTVRVSAADGEGDLDGVAAAVALGDADVAVALRVGELVAAALLVAEPEVALGVDVTVTDPLNDAELETDALGEEPNDGVSEAEGAAVCELEPEPELEPVTDTDASLEQDDVLAAVVLAVGVGGE